MTQLLQRLQDALADRYRIRRELGHGGMGVVALADDLRHDRAVAIKIIEPHVSGAVVRERFLREIRVGAALTHPHIIPLLDSGEAAGLLYYVMPYVEGETLRQLIERSAPLSLADATAICVTLADALGYAHARGLVHRDVKPENVILAAGHAYLADFGICRALDEAGGDGLTRAGVTLGTPAYMSPEQWAHPERVDGRSDLYSLGCILFELLTGEPPYSGSSPATLMARHAALEIPSVRLLRPGVSPALDEVVRSALAKVPAERVASAGEFADALRAAADPHTAGAATTGEHSTGGAGAAVTQGADAGLPGAPARPALRGLAGWRRLGYAMLAAAALATASYVVVQARDNGTAEYVVPRVAVGLVDNRTGNDSLDALGRMAAGWISEGLHRTGILAVAPSALALEAWDYVSSLERLEPGGRVAAFARETQSTVVVSGEYYRDGDSVQFLLQVTEAATGRMIAALDPARADPASPGAAIQLLRDRIMGALAVGLDERIGAAPATERPPSYEAYQAFSRGLDRYLRNQDRAAAEEFRTAFALDTSFTMPLLYEAFSRSNLGDLTAVDSLVRRVGTRRGELNVYHLNWFEYLEHRLRGDNNGALQAIRRAAEQAPHSKASYNRAWVALLANRPAEALQALAELDPDHGAMRGWFPYWASRTDAHHRRGEHVLELQAARAARERHPDNPQAVALEAAALAAQGATGELNLLFRELMTTRAGDADVASLMTATAAELRAHGHDQASRTLLDDALHWITQMADGTSTPGVLAVLAEVLHERGDWSAARAVIDGLVARLPGDVGYRAWAGVLAAADGDRDAAAEADQWLAELDVPWSFGRFTLHRARIAALLDQPDRAVRLLQQAYAEGLPAVRHADYNFHAMRQHPGLRSLLEPRRE